MIEINRIYVGSGLERKMLINLRYVKKIENIAEEDRHSDMARTRLILDDGTNEEGVIFSTDSYPTIKGKITRSRNR